MNEALGCDPSILPLASPSLAATCFAPAGRDAAVDIQRKAAALARVPMLSQTLDAMPNMVVILNRNRQIVAANRKFLGVLDASLAEVVEKRPGEAIRCIRAKDGPDGCGTGLHCTTCGAVQAIQASLKGQAEAVRECRILVHTPSEVVPLDLRVTATRFEVQKDEFVLAAIEDISHEKRVAVLQRAFFHDVLNTAGCIQGYVDYLTSDSTSDPEVSQRLTALSSQLIEEIQSQRDLLNAEAGDLETQAVPVKVRPFLEELRSQYLKHPVATDRRISIDQSWEGPIIVDRQLLQRVLGNMLKNALEATSPGGTVTIGCCEAEEAVAFSVHNREVMPPEVRLQVFQRSFTTKGQAGRGVGTYSMKLFGERYLGGTVSFTSRYPEGTTFRIQLPKKPLPKG